MPTERCEDNSDQLEIINMGIPLDLCVLENEGASECYTGSIGATSTSKGEIV